MRTKFVIEYLPKFGGHCWQHIKEYDTLPSAEIEAVNISKFYETRIVKVETTETVVWSKSVSHL